LNSFVYKAFFYLKKNLLQAELGRDNSRGGLAALIPEVGGFKGIIEQLWFQSCFLFKEKAPTSRAWEVFL
jgi:hypothetical protein